MELGEQNLKLRVFIVHQVQVEYRIAELSGSTDNDGDNQPNDQCNECTENDGAEVEPKSGHLHFPEQCTGGVIIAVVICTASGGCNARPDKGCDKSGQNGNQPFATQGFSCFRSKISSIFH